jgi:hypothetical protein
MTSLAIALCWIVLIGTIYLSMTVGFWLFVQAFGIVDNFIQDRHMAKKGFKKMADDKGKMWYVGYGE